jgi:hypothetical protein
MAARREIDADQAVQDVLSAWGALRTSPASRPLSTDFKALFEKMQASYFVWKFNLDVVARFVFWHTALLNLLPSLYFLNFRGRPCNAAAFVFSSTST